MILDKFRWQHKQELYVPWLLLLMLGLVMMSTASTSIAEHYTNNPAHFIVRQCSYIVAGVFAFYMTTLIPLKSWQRFDVLLLGLAVIGLILVFVPGIGHSANGSQRWLNLVIIKVQASEVAKFAAVFYIAGYLVRRQDEVMQTWRGFIKPLVVMFFVLILLFLEPDFGAIVVLMGAVLAQLFLGGVKAGQFFLLMVGALLLSTLALGYESYRMERLMAYLDPWAPEHVYDTGYQLTQSLIAFGRGEIFGMGLGESIQKLFFLPESHTDFVFAIWAEETGLVGAFVALGLLVYLVAKIWQVVWQAQLRKEMYSAYVAVGIASLFIMQTLINIGVNTGLLPTKGLTLPFYSYGGS
ncbi:MAG TPA: putative lipid II flippase FtsW, partial [Pseudomonadales bacterium]|nr:putative lipid II flippase FtsW [Pseudomonadales bacterium]